MMCIEEYNAEIDFKFEKFLSKWEFIRNALSESANLTCIEKGIKMVLTETYFQDLNSLFINYVFSSEYRYTA